MQKQLYKIIKKQDGAALLIVMMLVVLLSIILTVTASILTGNMREAKNQEHYLKAYYLAQSATDLCMAALLQQEVDDEDETDTLLYEEFSTNGHSNIANTPILADTVDLEGGSVDVTVRAITVSGERWVEIISVATLSDINITKTTTLQFQANNPLIKKEF